MKIYRYMPIVSTNEYSEASNLKKGIVAPSSEYFKYQKNPRQNLNSFTNEFAISKYFYASLYDTLNFQNNIYRYLINQGNECNSLIWEVDLPDEIIKKYIGIGYYNINERKIEFKIPYHILASYLGISLTEEYISILKILERAYKYNYLSEIDRQKLLELGFDYEKYSLRMLYQYLCFNIFMPTKILEKSTNLPINDYLNICAKVGYQHKSSRVNKYLGMEKTPELLYQEALEIEKENVQIKRDLKRENIIFKRI